MSKVYVPPMQGIGYCGPGTPPKPAPLRGELVSIEDAPDGSLDIAVDMNDGKRHYFKGCLITSYSSSMSAAEPNTLIIENISLVSEAHGAPSIEIDRLVVPAKMFHGVNEKIGPLPEAIINIKAIQRLDIPSGELNKNGDIITLTEEQIKAAKYDLLKHVEHLNKPHGGYSMEAKTGEFYMMSPPTYVGEISPRQDLPVKPKRPTEPSQDRERRANYLHHVALDDVRRILTEAQTEIKKFQGDGEDFSPKIQEYSTLLGFIIANLDHVKKEGMR